MENKIANWVELGIKPYNEVMEIQDRLVELRSRDLIPDTIISVQHPLTVSFGVDQKNNQFSDMFLSKVREKYGSSSHDEVVRYLLAEQIPFHVGNRGGGATVFAPGQFAFYPIVNHAEIVGKNSLDIGAYKSLIYKTLFDSLGSLGVNEVNVGSQNSFATRAERRDAWIVRDGITYKMGSKGINSTHGTSYNGFAINATQESIVHSWMVNQCGYKPGEVKLWSVEQELGRKVQPDEVYEAVKKAIGLNFRYINFQQIENLEGKNGN